MGILDSHLSDGSQEGEPSTDFLSDEQKAARKKKKRGGGRKPVYRTCVRCGEQKMGREMAQIPGEDGKLHRSKELCQPCFVAQNAEIRAERKASEREKAIKRELAQRTLAKRRLIQFVKKFHANYQAGWVHYDICRRLEKFMRDVEAGKNPRLMLFQPPRSGKSEIVSKMFPAWLLGHHPEWELAIASYNQELPNGFSRDIRSMLQTPEYQQTFPHTIISKDSRAVERWNTTKKGQLLAVGRGAGLTGKGFHCLPLDAGIETVSGTRTLGGLIKDGYKAPDVLSFDGTRIVRRKINGFITRKSDHLYTIKTTTGSFQATGEHPVCVGFRGERPVFRRVDELRRGEALVAIDPRAAQADETLREVPYLRQAIHQIAEEVQGGQPSVPTALACVLRRLRGSSQAASYAARRVVQRVRQTVRARGKRAQAQAQFLFQPMLRGVPQPNIQGKGAPLVQLEGSQLHAVRYDVQAETVACDARADEAPVLQPRLLRRVVAWSPYPEGLRTEWGTILPRRVQVDESLHAGREHGVHAVHEAGEGLAPQGRRHREQHDRELSAPVPVLSFEIPRPGVTESRVVDIAREQGEFVVGDLEVDGTHSFLTPQQLLMANCGIVDDPLKDAEEADSELIRERLWDWYSSTFYTRQHPGAGILVTLTRWHDDDLAGRLIQQMKELKKEGVDPEHIDNWEIIQYPALAEHDEYINTDGTITPEPVGEKSIMVRRKDEALHPERYNEAYLRKVKSTIQPRHWSALYQQNPVPDEGAYFQKSMFRYSKHPPAHEGMTVCIAGDLAIGQKQTNDWTVFAVAGMDYQGQIYILDIVRFRGDTHRIVETALDLCKKYNPALLGFEKGQIEMAIMPQLRRRMHERKQYPTLATGDKALNPNKDKPARARPLQGRMQQGMVYFAEEPWLEDLHHEFLRFPQGTHDDIVDAVAWVVAMLLKEPTPRNPHKTRKNKSWKDRLKGLNGPSKNPMAA